MAHVDGGNKQGTSNRETQPHTTIPSTKGSPHIAVLWSTFSAVGHAPPAAALILGYTIGYLANTLPVPGGVGVLDAGLVGALMLYGAAPAAAAVLVYHAIALWVPATGGMLASTRLRPRLAPRPAAPSITHAAIPAPEGGLP
jgi:hypothetical protein